MPRRLLAAALFACAAGCGKEAPPRPAPPPAPPPSPPPAAPGDDADAGRAVDEARAALKAAQEALDALVERHLAESAALGDVSMARDQGIRTKRELARASADLQAYEARLAQLEGSVSGARQEELVALRKERERLSQELSDAQSQRTREAVAAGQGRVDASPVAGELRVLREVQRAWLAATVDARFQEPAASEKQGIARKFRAWLEEKPERLAAVRAALEAAKGGLDACDITSFEFYLRCQLREDALDRLNVEVERKALDESRVRIEAVYAQLDELDEKLKRLLQAEGGDELRDHEEAKRRIAVLRPRRDDLQRLYDELQARLAPEAALRERHREEYAAAEAVVEQARRALAEARRRAGGGR